MNLFFKFSNFMIIIIISPKKKKEMNLDPRLESYALLTGTSTNPFINYQ